MATRYKKPNTVAGIAQAKADELRKKQIAAQGKTATRPLPQGLVRPSTVARNLLPTQKPIPQGKSTAAEVARGLLPKPTMPTEPLPQETPEVPATYAEIGAANIQADYDANLEAELGLTGGQKGYTSLDEYVKDQFKAQKEQKALQERQLADAELGNIEDTVQARAVMQGQVEAASDLIPSREGAVSGSNLSAYDRLKEASGVRISRLLREHETSQAAIAQARADLDRAERAGNTQLADQYRQTLLAAESAAMQTETNYVNALTMASEEERNVQAQKNANLSAFTALVDNGEVMSTSAISNFAETLGVPFEVANDYYEGAQMVRDDKSMDAATEKIELNKLAYDFDRKLRGIETQEAINVDNYMALVKSGQYTPEQLQAFAISMNIPDENNPVFQAELRLSQAQAKIAEDQANGVLTNPMDLVDLAQKTYDYYESIGYDPSMVPVGGEYGAVSYTTPDGIQGVRFGVEDGQNYDNPATARDESQCGAFVNDITGIGMGDGFNTGANNKMSFVDASIKVPAAGMVYVIPANGSYAKNGHTGMVEYYNPETSMVGVVSSNAHGDGKIVREEIPLSTILNGGGFVVPPNAKPANEMVTLDRVPKDLRTAVTTKANQFDAEPTVKNFQKVQEGWNFVNSLDPENSTSADDQALIYAFAKIMDPDSVVREGEYATIQKYSQSWAETFGFNAVRVADNIEFLSKEAKENRKKTLESKYNVSKASYDNVRNGYVQAIDNLGQTPGIGSSILQDYAFEYGADEEVSNTPEEEENPFSYAKVPTDTQSLIDAAANQ